jgi:hypothetical protein
MRTTSKTPGLRLVGGTDYGAAAGDARIEPCKKSVTIVVDDLISAPRNNDDPPATETLSTTAKNGKLREKRKESWRAAEAATRYWRVRLTLHDAVSQAQRVEIPEGRLHPDVDHEDRSPIVAKWREALARQVLTPAPDANSVKWKQAVLDSGDLTYTGVKLERVERAIADDLAFLAAHPVRQSIRRSAKANDDGGAA